MSLRSVCWGIAITSIWAVYPPVGRGSESPHAQDLFRGSDMPVSSHSEPSGGLLGEYFDGYRCRGVPALTRIDPEIDFDWTWNRPDWPMPNEHFSARWSGYLRPLYNETYTLSTWTSRSVKISLADKQIEWVLRGVETQGKVELVAGETYSIEIIYNCTHLAGTIKLFWESPSQPREIIPASALQPPLRTSHPFPADGATEVPQDITVHWTMGGRTTHHDIYLGVDADAVAQATTATAGVYRGRQTRDVITFTPGPLEWNTTYWWRIDEVNDAHPESPWKGNVWRFTTADFLLIDDFESYDEENNRIYDTWIDGWAGNGTGAIVGDMYTPYVDLTIVHGGEQSMPFNYDNSTSPCYSETYRTWETPQDWTVNGVTDLSLWVRGSPLDFLEKEDATILVSGDGTWQDKSEGFRYAYKQLTGNGEIVARVEGLRETNDGARAGVMIHEIEESWFSVKRRFVALAVTSAHGLVFTSCPESSKPRQQIIVPAIQPPHWLKLIRTNDMFTAQHSKDGITWQDVADAEGKPAMTDLSMSHDVQVGLFASSNQWMEPTTAEFSNIAITGAVSNSWQVASINSSAWSNSPDKLYIALRDATGSIATSVHPNPAALNIAEWLQWRIPLSDFATSGLDLRTITRMCIGVGDRDSPQPGGSGLIYIDDIRVIRGDNSGLADVTGP